MADREYTVNAPDGSTLKITGPDNASVPDLRAAAERAFARVKNVAQHAGGQAAAADLPGALKTAAEPAAAAIPPLAAMAIPAATTAAGTAIGGPVGGVVGAFTGQAINEGIDAGVKWLGGEAQPPLTDRAMRVGEVTAATGAVAGAGPAARWAASKVAPKPGAIADTAQRQGIPLTWAEAHPSVPGAHGLEALSARSLGGRGVMERRSSEQANALQARANTLAEELRGRPGAIDVADTNNRFAKAIRVEYDGARKKTRQLYEDAFTAAGPDTPIPPQALLTARANLATEFPNLPPSRAATAIDKWAESLKPAMSREETAIRAQFGLKPSDPIPAAFQQHIPAAADRVPTLAELRGLKNSLNTLARSSDPVERGQAEHLRKALDESLEATVGQNPQAKALFDQAAAMHRDVVVPLRDGSFKDLVRGNPKLGGPTLAGFNERLFDAKDPGFLDDALRLAGPEGRRLIQEQYTNSRFTGLYTRTQDGRSVFDSAKFAKQIEKDTAIIDRLFGNDQRRALQEFAQVANATRATQGRTGELLGVLVEGGQAHAMLNSLINGRIGTTAATALGAPWLYAKLATDPRWVRGVTSVLRAGHRVSITGAAALTNLATQDQPGAPGGPPLPAPPGQQSRGANPLDPPLRVTSLQ